MRTLTFICCLICSIIATSGLSFMSVLKKPLEKSNKCKTPEFNSNFWIKVYIISDIGKPIARCFNCGPMTNSLYYDSAAIYGEIGDVFARWRLYPGCNGQVAMQSVDNGKYLASCHNCWQIATYPYSAFVETSDPNDSGAHWTMINNGDSTYSFQSENGIYLARCSNCVSGGTKTDYLLLYATSNTDSRARFRLQLA